MSADWLYSWKDDDKVCGNCQFWQLGGYQHDWPGCAPSGNVGYHCNGDAGECRRRAPIAITQPSPGANAVWPHTDKKDTCGDFEKRAKPFRRERQEYQPTDITGAPLDS